MNDLDIFFVKNEIKVGQEKHVQVKIPIYYSSLDEAFFHYFLTFHDKNSSYHFLLNPSTWTPESLSFNFFAGYENVVFSILSFHRFIELFIKDILKRINPFLAVKFIEKEEELFKFLDNNISPDEVKTVEYSEAYKRFKQAYRHYDRSSDVYNTILKDFEFLIERENSESLRYLTDWRNRIMHNGQNMPNVFAYDYLISQRIIPIVFQIIEADSKKLEGYKPYYFKTKTGINIIEEINNLKIDYKDFSSNDPQKNFFNNYLKLGHLKELGRASMKNNYWDRKNLSYFESNYKNPIGRYERFAQAEKVSNYYYNLKNCPCCGEKTLLVYKEAFFNIIENKDDNIKWVKCYCCDYFIKDNVDDPLELRLSEYPLFDEIPEKTSLDWYLSELRSLSQQHFDIGLKLFSGHIYAIDLIVSSVLKRSVSLIDGFCTFIEKKNFICAAPMVRMQIDNAIRLYGTSLVENPNEVVIKILEGFPLSKIEDRNNRKKLTDQYLIDNLSKVFPWIKRV
ncbi:MAG: hypothetical protein CVU05_14725, partial [Bacteroidetes bacterium HGW-Bacteroidetes-21]